MFCPGCRAEFREGFTRCVTCDRDLVEEADLPPEPVADPLGDIIVTSEEAEEMQHRSRELSELTGFVVVFESIDPFLIRTVEKVLADSNLPFSILNGEPGRGFPSAIFGTGSQPACNPTLFLVPQAREAEAKGLLVELQTFSDLPPELAEATDESDPEGDESEDFGEGGDADDSSRESAASLFCPHCGAELDSDEGRLSKGRIACPVCEKVIEL